MLISSRMPLASSCREARSPNCPVRLAAFSAPKLQDLPLFVHIDLVAGLENSEAGLEFLAESERITGVVTVHHHLAAAGAAPTALDRAIVLVGQPCARPGPIGGEQIAARCDRNPPRCRRGEGRPRLCRHAHSASPAGCVARKPTYKKPSRAAAARSPAPHPRCGSSTWPEFEWLSRLRLSATHSAQAHRDAPAASRPCDSIHRASHTAGACGNTTPPARSASTHPPLPAG